MSNEKELQRSSAIKVNPDKIKLTGLQRSSAVTMEKDQIMGASSKMLCSTPIAPSRREKRPRLGSNSCPKCDKHLEGSDDALLCSICELGYCMDCTNISRPLFIALKQENPENCMWTCNGCKQNFPSLTGMKKQLKTIEETTNTKLATIEHKMGAIGSVIKEQVQEEIINIKPSLIETIKGEIKSTLQDDVRKEVREIEDQKIRAMNLILFNVPESSSESSEIRKEHDGKMLNELCAFIKVENPDIKTMFRLGNRSSRHTRPLKLIFNNKKQRKDILDNANKLKNMQDTHHLSKCIIAKDLTVQQRTENKKRRASKKTQVIRRPESEDKSELPPEQKTATSSNELQIVADVLVHDTSGNYMEETIVETQQETLSQGILAPLNNMEQLSLSSIGENTIIGGFDVGHNTVDSPSSAANFS